MKHETPHRLCAEIAACRACAERFAATCSGHTPRPVVRLPATARLLIAGQAPGARVHASGTPFLDASGDRLRAWMGVTAEAFYDQSRVAIAPMAFCFPGYDAKGAGLPPPPLCAALWRERVLATMPQIETVLLVGGYAQRWHLGPLAKGGVTATTREWRRLIEPAQGPRYCPLPHPSWRNGGWLRKNPWFETDVLPWLRAEVSRLLR